MESPVTADQALRVVSLIDLTDLDDARRPDGIEPLVQRAVERGVPAVCVWPDHVARVAELLDVASSHDCAIATVVNFPTGAESIDDVVATTRQAHADGADEIDLVLPYRALQDGDDAAATAMVETIRDVVHGSTGRLGSTGHLKVILETGELVDGELIERAARLAIEAGADFIKTSTGKSPISATLDAADRMVTAIADADRTVGLKPSGGIRTVADAMTYLDLVDRRLGPEWATASTFRFGASGLLDDAVRVIAAG
jgi:deoxyribose-phosphate aldolase